MDSNSTALADALSNALDKSGDSANKVALAAAVLAAAAFLVAVLQTSLEYAGSAASRHKCSFSAIHGSSKQVKIRWSWKLWRLNVFYPVLDFNVFEVLDLVVTSSLAAINSPISPIHKIQTSHEGWGWSSLEEKEIVTRNTVADPFTRLISIDGPITSKQLSWSEYITFLKWKFRNRSQITTRPRASWAQLLLAFGISDTKVITYKHADADLIPNSFDAPVQRIKLFDLGLLAFLLGFTTVEINPQDRTFEATGPFGTITTLSLPDSGKILRFEGDIFAMKQSVSKGSPLILIRGISSLNGQLQFGEDYMMNGYFYPLHLLKDATSGNWSKPKFRTELFKLVESSFQGIGFAKGQIVKEVALFRDIFEAALRTEKARAQGALGQDRENVTPEQRVYRTLTNLSLEYRSPEADRIDSEISDTIEKVCAEWQQATGQAVPTILAVGVLANLSGAKIGFPSTLLLRPFLPWIRFRANDFATGHLPNFRVSYQLFHAFQTHDLEFVRPDERFWISLHYRGLTNLLSGAKESWCFPEILEVYDNSEQVVKDMLVLKDSEGNYTGEVGTVLFPDMMLLIANYDPNAWAEAVQNTSDLSPYNYRPANMLWAQVLLLDVSIRLFVLGVSAVDESRSRTVSERQLEGDSPDWDSRFAAIYGAVADCWVCETLEPIVKPTQATESNTVPGPEQASQPPQAQTEHSGPQGPAHEPPTPSAPAETTPSDTTQDTSRSRTIRNPRDSLLEARAALHDRPSYADWDLARALSQQPQLVFSADPSEQQMRINQLAALLELRALFVLAFLLLCPDTTDVYLAEGSEVEMPMI